MTQAPAASTGIDFTRGVRLTDIPLEGMLAGTVGDEPVLLSRIGGELFAVAASCTHYGGDLASGLRVGETVRCPLHHACFSLRTGEALRAPAFAPLDRWRVERAGSLVFVREKEDGPAAVSQSALPAAVGPIVIVGGGAAGFACAEMLRRLGHGGPLTILSDDDDAPYDRPNLSKDFLAGTAPDEWMPLRPPEYYRDAAIDLRLGAAVAAIEAGARTVTLASGEVFPFERLLLATGSVARNLEAPGFDRPNVHRLRTFADARLLAERARAGARAIILGSGFIGMEAAAALSSRGVEIDIVSSDSLPMGRALGAKIGGFLRALHEAHGVRFHFGRTATSFDGRTLILDEGALEADFVLVGIGASPRTELASAAGLAAGDGILVDQYLETSAPGIFAAGDVASYPDARSGGRLRIEHWVTAQRQGQAAAFNMLGGRMAFDAVPFFWTDQYGTVLRLVGHSGGSDHVRIEGSPGDGDFSVSYIAGEALGAFASVGLERESLEAEVRLERDFAASPAA